MKTTITGSQVYELALQRRADLIALINTYNEASNPSVPRTDSEHKEQNQRARIALGSIRRNFIAGTDYKELSNGALWPMPEEWRCMECGGDGGDGLKGE